MKRKKTDIPEQIVVGAHKIPVKFKSDLLGHAEAFGLFDKNEMAIYIDAALENNGSLAWETFWHEVWKRLTTSLKQICNIAIFKLWDCFCTKSLTRPSPIKS